MTDPRRVPPLLRIAVRALEPRFREAFGDQVEALIAETWLRDIAHQPFPKRQLMTLRLVVDTVRRGFAQRMTAASNRSRHPERWEARVLETTYQDLRHALRSLRKQPGVVFTIVTTMGLGIGGVTTVLGAMDAELWRALPFPDADRLVVVQESYRGNMRNASLPNLMDWREQSSSFVGLTGFDDRKLFTITGASEPLRVYGAAVDGHFFHVLGIDPSFGRFIRPADDRPEASRVVVLGEAFWRREFGADSGLIGQTVIMNRLPYTVVGVAPVGFRIPNEEQVWVPLHSHPFGDDRLRGRSARILEVVGRLRPTATVRDAQTEMEIIARRLADAHPEANADWGALVVPLREQVVGQSRPTVLTASLVGVSILLLLTCVNVANLLLARTLRRRREMAIRVALGAGRARIAKQLMLESTVLGLGGGVVGVVIAVWGHRMLVQLLPDWFPVLATQGFNPRTLVMAAGVASLAGVIAGLAPAWFAAHGSPSASLNEGDARTGAGRGYRRFRNALVVVEVTMALTLLIGAGLLLRSFDRLSRVAVGLDASNVLTAVIDLPLAEYPVGERTASFYEELTTRLESHPAVSVAAASSRLPLSGATSIGGFQIEGRPETLEDPPSAHRRLVTAGIFEALGIPLLGGRAFTDADGSAPVVIVDDEIVQRHFGGENPMGSRIRLGEDGVWRTVLGVVGATRHWGAQNDRTPTIYLPHRAMPQGAMTVALRTTIDPRVLAPVLRQEVWSRDGDLAVSQVQTLQAYVDRSVAAPRFNAILFSVFAGFAVLLAGLGLYALIAFGVAQRTREIGLRVALGAQSADVARMVIRQALGITLAGVVIGLAVAVAGGRVLEALLFEISGRDLPTFGAAASLLIGIAIVASALPARRAARLDPVIALRET